MALEQKYIRINEIDRHPSYSKVEAKPIGCISHIFKMYAEAMDDRDHVESAVSLRANPTEGVGGQVINPPLNLYTSTNTNWCGLITML